MISNYGGVTLLHRNAQNRDSRPACDHCAKDFKQYGTVSQWTHSYIICNWHTTVILLCTYYRSLLSALCATCSLPSIAESAQGKNAKSFNLSLAPSLPLSCPLSSKDVHTLRKSTGLRSRASSVRWCVPSTNRTTSREKYTIYNNSLCRGFPTHCRLFLKHTPLFSMR